VRRAALAKLASMSQDAVSNKCEEQHAGGGAEPGTRFKLSERRFMVQLVDSDIRTREVLGWQGVHVLHFMGSSCSQKLRIFLNLKKIPWQSHPIDLPSNENMQSWFLGINPRGLVPVLVHDGAVHIESNDIIQYLEERFPTPQLIPAGHENEVAALLKHEDDLHLDLRTLSFRFVFAPPGPPKPAAALESYIANGAGTVQGVKDHEKQIQIEFWQRAALEGFTDAQARASALKFRAEFGALDKTLAKQPYLMGDHLSVLDIAWLIYEHRLSLAGYPFERLHPHVHAWAERLRAMPEFAKEVTQLRHSAERLDTIRRTQSGNTLEMIAGF
jgi:glutathione S-transferase